MTRVALLAAVLLLGGCEAQHQDNAMLALRALCALHRSEVTHGFLPQAWIDRGNALCAWVS